MGSLMKPQALDMMAHALRRLILNFARWRKDSGIRREIIFGGPTLEWRRLFTSSSFSDCVRRMCHTTSFRLRPGVWLARFSIKAFVFDLLRFSFLPHNIGS